MTVRCLQRNIVASMHPSGLVKQAEQHEGTATPHRQPLAKSQCSQSGKRLFLGAKLGMQHPSTHWRTICCCSEAPKAPIRRPVYHIAQISKEQLKNRWLRLRAHSRGRVTQRACQLIVTTGAAEGRGRTALAGT